MLIILAIVLTVVLPIAWLVADLRGPAIARRALGVITILWSFGVAALCGSLERFNANSYFSGASQRLLEGSVQQLRAGKTDAVLREWTRAMDQFHPTYENRARYEQIVNETLEGMKK